MYKLLMTIIFGFYLVGAEVDTLIIDLNETNKFETGNYDWKSLKQQFSPFNDAIEFGIYFDFLKETYSIDTAIETGTWKGQTTALLSLLFPSVYSIEINKEHSIVASNNLSDCENVTLIQDNSPNALKALLPKLKLSRIIFYLDAHWEADWPLLDELSQISKTHRDNCIIVIDDFKVPGRDDIPFDAYAGNACSYEYIKNQLSKVYSSYSYYYLIPKKPGSRAKFIAIPDAWFFQE